MLDSEKLFLPGAYQREVATGEKHKISQQQSFQFGEQKERYIFEVLFSDFESEQQTTVSQKFQLFQLRATDFLTDADWQTFVRRLLVVSTNFLFNYNDSGKPSVHNLSQRVRFVLASERFICCLTLMH